MTNPKFSGSFGNIYSPTMSPEFLASFQAGDNGLSNLAILSESIYVEIDDKRLPMWLSSQLGMLQDPPNMEHKIALWPDGVFGFAFYQTINKFPSNEQLIRIYHNARHLKLATETHNLEKMGAEK